MKNFRWVVEVGEEPGYAPSERRTAAIVERLAERLGSLLRDGVEVDVRPLVCSVTEEELDELRDRAAGIATPGEEFSRQDWQFGGYVAIDVAIDEAEALQTAGFARPTLTDAIRDAKLELRRGPWVESVRPGLDVRDDGESFGSGGAAAGGITPRRLLLPDRPQLSAPDEILAEAAVGLTVIETSWWLDHEEIDQRKVCEISTRGPGTGSHGLATLGVLIGGEGGIVPWLPSVGLSSPYDRCGGTEANWTDAVLHAVVHLGVGGVVLLEQQDEVWISGIDPGWRNLPPEVYPGVAKAIGLGSAAGVTIVEPAGNARGPERMDFDNACLRAAVLEGKYLWPTDHDSGAVLVGAVSPLDEDCYLEVSVNTGSRIDIQAPGTCYETPGWYPQRKPEGDQKTRTSRTQEYGQTSGASAIVAAVLVLIQSMRRAGCQDPLIPRDLRKVVRDVAASARTKPRCGMGVRGAPTVDDFLNAALAVP